MKLFETKVSGDRNLDEIVCLNAERYAGRQYASTRSHTEDTWCRKLAGYVTTTRHVAFYAIMLQIKFNLDLVHGVREVVIRMVFDTDRADRSR
jgi:hypothetical protein